MGHGHDQPLQIEQPTRAELPNMVIDHASEAFDNYLMHLDLSSYCVITAIRVGKKLFDYTAVLSSMYSPPRLSFGPRRGRNLMSSPLRRVVTAEHRCAEQRGIRIYIKGSRASLKTPQNSQRGSFSLRTSLVWECSTQPYHVLRSRSLCARYARAILLYIPQ